MDDLVARSPFVFHGTVESVGTATTAAVATTELSATVRVNEVVRAPQALRRLAGQLITVELTGFDGIEPGARFIFFTRPKLFADTLVVTEIGRQPDEGAASAAAADIHDSFARLATMVLIPITWPWRFTSAPPEFPGLIAQSVWMRFSYTRPSCSSLIGLPSALTTP